jgi:hypothetical protein
VSRRTEIKKPLFDRARGILYCLLSYGDVAEWLKAAVC